MPKFRVGVTDEILDDLQLRLRLARFPDQIGSPWEYGTDITVLKQLVDYWQTAFNWRSQESLLNSFPQFLESIHGMALHFVHVKSASEDAPALMLVHGWPGSFFEFYKVIPLLSPHFHLIVPSLPGYGFSAAPREPGFDTLAAASALNGLMAQLGYSRYFAQGGDWGSVVVKHLAMSFPESCRAIHINMPVTPPPMMLGDYEMDTADKAFFDGKQDWDRTEAGYQKIQGSKPQTLAYALNDSPVGLLAWVLEKFRAWSDCGGEPLSVFSKDELLTNVMIYWTTQSIGPSMRLYYESLGIGTPLKREAIQNLMSRCEAPTAVAIFPREISRPPRRLVAAFYNLQQWTEFDKGGHFAALERPEDLARDIMQFFGQDAVRSRL